MTIALQVIPDRFSGIAQNTQDIGNVASAYSANGVPFIRRPTRGIVLKEETFATIRVAIGSTGQNKLLVDAGSRRTGPTYNQDGTPDSQDFLEINGKRATDIYSNFLLQQVQEERMEKQQILETFGEPYIFLFGERARMISFSGVLANTFDFNWESEWWWNYDNYLRGTKCVENDARVFISYDNTIVGGYIISTGSTKVSQERNWVNFQFQMFVTSYSNFSAIGDPTAYPGFPIAGMNGERTVDDATAQVFRPNLLQSTTSTQDGTSLNGPATLFEGLENAVQVVSDAWSKADQVINNVLSGVNDAMNGLNVRVPYGYAGTMAFDDAADVNLPSVSFGESISYTTFSDNNDEYVGLGDQYGSADPNLFSAIPGLGFDNTDDEMEYNQGLVQQAQTIWEDAGYPIPDLQLGPVSQFIVKKSLGLLAVGASSAWTSFSHTAIPGSAGGSFAAGLGKVLPLPE